METRKYSIEIDGREVLWFGFDAAERTAAYATFQKICNESSYSGKDIVLINVETDTELGHRFVRAAA